MTDRRITDGGRDIRALVTEQGISLPDWCEKHGLDRIQVQRVVNGSRYKRISVDFADEIFRATAGRISPERFRSCTARPADPATEPDVDGDAEPESTSTRAA